jgi:hypothetical protein
MSYNAGVEGVMPRAWSALRVGSDSDAGTVWWPIRQRMGGGLKVADVLDVIVLQGWTSHPDND